MINKNQKTIFPYCPVCEGCGEEGCCSPLRCQQSKDGHHCQTYLKDLKFGYLMYEDLYALAIKDKKRNKKALDKLFDKNYDKIYNTEIKSVTPS